jgi:hypothetical protein
MALIDRDRKLGDIQSEEKKGICSCKTGDSTCCPKASKGPYLYYSAQGCATSNESWLTHIQKYMKKEECIQEYLKHQDLL